MKSIRLFLIFALLFSAKAFAIPHLRFHAAPEYRGVANRLAAVSSVKLGELDRFIGPITGDAIDVTLAGKDSSLAHGVPPWASGYALSERSFVVIFPARNISYPDDSLEETLLHELAHVYVYRAAAGREVPRWFNEGVAVVAGRAWTLEDQARFSYASIYATRIAPGELDQMFLGDASHASRAYAVSDAIVRNLVRERGPGVVRDVMAGLRRGDTFSAAFFQATLTTPERAFEQFWETQGWKHGLLPVLTSSALLWLIVTLIAIAAIRRRRSVRKIGRRAGDEIEPWPVRQNGRIAEVA
jgi:hypothetical protein